MTPAARRRSFVRLLEVDPDLGSGMTESEVRSAINFLTARTTTLPRGRWDPAGDSLPQEPSSLGVLVVDGLLARRVQVLRGTSLELVGPGDLACPWARDAGVEEGPRTAHWEVLSPAVVAWLDQEFTRLVVNWPAIVAQIVKRGLQQAAYLAYDLAISHIVGVDLRLLQLLTHLAERWGIVTQEGVVVPIPLTNEMMGAMIGARPPSVSTALRKLTQDKRVLRRRDGTWLLHPHALSAEAGQQPAVVGS